jgi:hypothetical protein
MLKRPQSKLAKLMQEVETPIIYSTYVPGNLEEADLGGINRDTFNLTFAKEDKVAAAAVATAAEEDEFNRPKNRRPVTVIPEIQRRFLEDPKEAVKNNVGVHHRPEQIDAIEDDVIKIAEARQRQSDVADQLWSNEDFEFLSLVKGITRDGTLMNREVNTFNSDGRLITTVGAGPRSIGLLQSGPLVDVSRRGPTATEAKYIFNPAVRPLPRDATQQQRDDHRVETANLDRLRMLENVDRIMEEPQVSGVMQMSSVMFGALQEALSHLVIRNRAKYAHKNKNHFYPDFHVKVFFAQLVATLILFNKVTAPNQYYKVVEEPRRQAAISNALNNLDHNVVWEADRKCFVLATQKKTEEIKRKKRQLLLEAYNIDSLLYE